MTLSESLSEASGLQRFKEDNKSLSTTSQPASIFFSTPTKPYIDIAAVPLRAQSQPHLTHGHPPSGSSSGTAARLWRGLKSSFLSATWVARPSMKRTSTNSTLSLSSVAGSVSSLQVANVKKDLSLEEGYMVGDIATDGAVGFLYREAIYTVAHKGKLKKKGKSLSCKLDIESQVLVKIDDAALHLLSRDGHRRLETYVLDTIESVNVVETNESNFVVLQLAHTQPVVLATWNTRPLVKALKVFAPALVKLGLSASGVNLCKPLSASSLAPVTEGNVAGNQL